MNTRLVNAAASEITTAMESGRRTPAGWAMALDAKGFLTSPEVAAELESLRARIAELESLLRLRSTQRGDVARLIEVAGRCGEDCVDVGELQEALSLDADDVAAEPDAITKVFAPTQALQPEGEFEATLRHPYRLGHDMPETGGTK